MAQIKTFIEPKRLYRYRSMQTDEHFDREIAAISEGYLWFSPFREMNDPMEGRYRSSLALRNSPKYAEIKDSIFEIKSSIGICSFSEIKNNELMWAHYADQFRGICIEYNMRRIKSYLSDEIDIIRLTYSDSAHTLHSTSAGPANLARAILSNKSYRWLYEREWRLLAPHTGRINSKQEDLVSCVYLGNRIDAGRKRALEASLKPLNIPIKEMKISGYSMTFSEIIDSPTRLIRKRPRVTAQV